MSGYVVTAKTGKDHNGKECRNLFMVNNADPKSACAEINRFMSADDAHALTLLSDEQLKHFGVDAGQPWLFTTIHSSTSTVTSSSMR